MTSHWSHRRLGAPSRSMPSDATIPSDPLALRRVAILGLGLIGGSIGQALYAQSAGTRVTGWDPDDSTVNIAAEIGAIQSSADGPEEAVSGANLVVLCAPVERVIPLLRQIAPNLEPSTVVTDVGSTKARIVREAEQIIGGRFVGGHPMAGSESSGIHAASPDLFSGASWAVTPTPATDRLAVDLAANLITTCKAHVFHCSPEDHDLFVAYFSHLPHILSFGLAKTAFQGPSRNGADLAAGSFRDGTRVAMSDPERWTEILMDNRAESAEALGNFLSWCARVRSALVRGDRNALSNLLSDAHFARKQMVK